MTMPEERTRHVLAAREFLQELTNPDKTPGVPDDIRRQAKVLLRHYPGDSELHLAHLALPHLFAPVRSEVEMAARISGAVAAAQDKPEPGREAA